MKIGVVGATGLVGQNFLKILEEDLGSAIKEIRLFSSRIKNCHFNGQTLKTQLLKTGCFKGLDICFFSAGEKVSKLWAPQAVKEDTIVIDNSSAFREDPDKLLIVPEINAHLLKYQAQIISNPNCSTIQLVMALQALHKSFVLKSVQVVSLQSISGAGREALEKLTQETRNILDKKTPYEQDEIQSAFNCIPYIGSINKEGFCTEEIKIMTESKKILNLPDLNISAFTVRVPTLNSHSEVLWCQLKNSPANKQEIIQALSSLVKVQESPPHARGASGKRDVFVGRIHQDQSRKNSWIMWLVADNLLKGASLNGLQIAQKLWEIKANT